MCTDLDTLAALMAPDAFSRRFAALVADYAAAFGMSTEVARAELLERLEAAPTARAREAASA